jgi:GAF domain-containing protein
MKPPHLENEEQRLAELALYNILDTAEEQAYDDLTALAAYIAQTPIAIISLIDKDRQWYKSGIGVTVSEVPRELTFCAHAIINPASPTIVPDAKLDTRFMDNPAVTVDQGIRFYGGFPLVTESNFPIGTLCVVDHRPRNFSLEQIDALAALTRQALLLLEIRRQVFAIDEIIERGKQVEKRNGIDEIDRIIKKLEGLLRERKSS